MTKIVTEVAICAAAIGAAFLLPGIGAMLDIAVSQSFAYSVMGSAIAMAASGVMQGIADALKGNQGGLAVGVKTPIGPWGYVYGT